MIRRLTLGSGIAAGAEAVANAFRREIVARGLDAAVEITGCVGMCHREVLAEVAPAGGGTFLYGDLTADRVPRIAHEHLANGVPVGEWLVLPEGSDLRSLPYFAGQRKIVLANCGFVDPEKIGDSIRRGGGTVVRNLRHASPSAVSAALRATASSLSGVPTAEA